MNAPSNSVVHLNLRRNSISLGIGSGVLYVRSGKTYIVTAWHNVTGRHSQSLKCLTKSLATPDNVIVSIASKMSMQGNEFGYIRREITVPLEVEGETTYYIHPQGWPRVDVVAIPIDPKNAYLSDNQFASGEEINFPTKLVDLGSNISLSSDIEHIQDAESGTTNIDEDLSTNLYAGDDIYILGYPEGVTDYTGQPLWKRASVATQPHLGWNNQPQFLVDCASKKGMSGAPVIYYNRLGTIQIGGMTYANSGPVSILHGIYVGRIGSTTEFEAQIGTVWKRSVIDEIIDEATRGQISDDISLPPSQILTCIKENWPDTENYAEFMLDKNCHYIHGFVHSVMKSLEGRANPNSVQISVKDYASSLLESGA